MSSLGSWYALRVRQRSENLAELVLQEKGFEPFLPSYVQKRQWSDRVTTFNQPLFPGYVFCRFDLRHCVPVLRAPGVISILGAGNVPIALEESEIQTIRRVAGSLNGVEPWPFLECGQRVTIATGPLRGLTGILVEVKNSYRVVVSVSLLRRSIAVEVDCRSILPVGASEHRYSPSMPSVAAAGD